MQTPQMHEDRMHRKTASKNQRVGATPRSRFIFFVATTHLPEGDVAPPPRPNRKRLRPIDKPNAKHRHDDVRAQLPTQPRKIRPKRRITRQRPRSNGRSGAVPNERPSIELERKPANESGAGPNPSIQRRPVEPHARIHGPRPAHGIETVPDANGPGRFTRDVVDTVVTEHERP